MSTRTCTQNETDERTDNVIDLRDLPLATQGRIAQRLLATRGSGRMSAATPS
ncbi:hypothetical protein ACPPVT_14270 [Angustibacter sp. McL0619]|uniref:hypothetical protein n=1 Tax=Angustibacter sp. McL0619 TaxID=3415676 RepID=UPI003CF6CBF3